MSEELKFSDLKNEVECDHDHILGMDGDRIIRTSEPNGLEEIVADHDFWAFRFCPMCGINLFADELESEAQLGDFYIHSTQENFRGVEWEEG